MPSIGDTKTLFGRRYVYVNPNQALGPGTWLLSDNDSSGDVGIPTISNIPIYGQATVAAISQPIKRGMLIYLNDLDEAVAGSALSADTAKIVGVATEAANIGQVTQFTQNSVIDLFNCADITDEGTTTLEVGSIYYLSANNPGYWTTIPDRTSVDAVILPCGTAVNDNYMAIDIDPISFDSGVYA